MITKTLPTLNGDYRNILRRIPANCVAYYPALPEGFSQSTIKDYSGNGNHGTITGATWVKRPSGLLGLNFTIDDYVDIAASTSLNFTDAGTWMVWVILRGTPAGWERVFSKGYAETFLAFNASTSPIMRINGLGGGAGQYAFVGSLTVNVPALIGFTYDKDGGDNNLKLYINGSLDSQNTETGTIGGTSAWALGSTSAHGEKLQAGDIYLFRVLNRAITASQWASIFSQERHLFRI